MARARSYRPSLPSAFERRRECFHVGDLARHEELKCIDGARIVSVVNETLVDDLGASFGSDVAAVSLAAAMKRRGYDIRAIRPPTVPEGTSRLRLTITLNVDEAQITRLIDDSAEAEAANAA